MKFSRKEEINLIELGMKQVLSKYFETNLPESKPKKAKSIPKTKPVAKATKPHWTQTAKGKKKMAKAMKAMWKTKRAKKNV